MRRRFLAALAVGAFSGTGLRVAYAQAWPSRPIRLIYPFPPGGSDGGVRLYADKLGQALGESMVVDNRGGAGGNIGADIAAKSAPDGYTIFVGTNGSLAINPGLYQSMSFDPQRDFAPVCGLFGAPQILVVPAATPVNTAQELIQKARAEPGQLTYGSVGQGSASHLTMEMFKSITGTDITHVPYKGAGPAILDLLAGRVTMMTVIAGSVMPQIKAGKLKALAVTSPARSAIVPTVPTMGEVGVKGLDVVAWLAVVVPTGTPKDIVARIRTETFRFLDDPNVRKQLLDQGFEPLPWSGEELGERMRIEREMWGKVIKSTGTRLE